MYGGSNALQKYIKALINALWQCWIVAMPRDKKRNKQTNNYWPFLDAPVLFLTALSGILFYIFIFSCTKRNWYMDGSEIVAIKLLLVFVYTGLEHWYSYFSLFSYSPSTVRANWSQIGAIKLLLVLCKENIGIHALRPVCSLRLQLQSMQYNFPYILLRMKTLVSRMKLKYLEKITGKKCW